MNKAIKKYIGNYYIFKLSGHFVSGYFCGIGEINNKYGMIFIDVKSSGIKIPHNCCMLVAPEQIKCTLKSNMIHLRKLCRKIFINHNLSNHHGPLYYPTFQINKIEHTPVK
jgi:hypothetical protein